MIFSSVSVEVFCESQVLNARGAGETTLHKPFRTSLWLEVRSFTEENKLLYVSLQTQVQEDVYEKLDKELLTYVEDVLLNRRPDSTERMMEYAATLDPKSHPTKLRKLAGESNAPVFQAKLNPIPAGFNPVALPDVLPPVPEYKPWVDPLAKSVAFEQLEKLFEERIAYIDGAMGTMIQRYKLQVWLAHLVLGSTMRRFCNRAIQMLFMEIFGSDWGIPGNCAALTGASL